MANNEYSLSPTWSSSARYTASGETPVKVANPNDNWAIHWTIINGADTTPTAEPNRCSTILPGESQDITLADTDRLWIAGMRGYASVET